VLLVWLKALRKKKGVVLAMPVARGRVFLFFLGDGLKESKGTGGKGGRLSQGVCSPYFFLWWGEGEVLPSFFSGIRLL